MLLKEKYPHIFLCATVYRSMTSGRRGTPCFIQEIRTGELVLKIGDFVIKETSGGATVVRQRRGGLP